MDEQPAPADTDHKAVTIGLTADGSAVVHKRFDGNAADAGLDEATWLATATHPGVVRLVGRTEHPPTNVTEHVAGPTLRTAGLDLPAAAVVLAGVARTLADLHQRSMVHGAVTPDHILLATRGAGGPTAMLCSPAGADDILHDAHGLGRCITWLLSDWKARKLAVPNEWADLADRLATEPPLDLRRAARQLAALGPDPAPPASTPKPPRPGRRQGLGLTRWLAATSGVALIGALTFVLVSWAAADAPAAQALPGVRLDSSEGIFVVGTLDDDAVALPNPCPGQPHALYLDVASGTVWVFETIDDGATGEPMTVVPGATSLIAEEADPCPRVWARGPAGRVELDWP